MLTGKILRRTRDGLDAPATRTENSTASYGHRNIEGLAFDARARCGIRVRRAGRRRLEPIVKGRNYGLLRPRAAGMNDSVNPESTWRPSTSSPAGLAIAHLPHSSPRCASASSRSP